VNGLPLVAQLAILIPVHVASFLITRWCDQHPDWGYYWFAGWTLWCVGWAALDLAGRRWGSVAVDVVCAALFARWWWQCRKRRKRKRATELAGYKAKAIAEKIATKQREAAQRRPVLSPIPGEH